MPPWLSSVPRPSTTVVEKPFEVTTRTGISTGRRSQRRVFPEFCIIINHHLLLQPAANYQSDHPACSLRRVETNWRKYQWMLLYPGPGRCLLYNFGVTVRLKVCLAAL